MTTTYTITAGNDSGYTTFVSASARSASAAAEIAREFCQNYPAEPVYVAISRKGEGHVGYLLPSGDHDPNGQNWNA